MAGRDRDIQQVRFINGMEVLMNILHWEEDTFIEANNCLAMEPLEGEFDDDKSYYVLRPMVSYSDDLGKPVTINPGSIMCLCEPSETVLEQYRSSLASILNQLEDPEPPIKTSEPTSNIVSFTSKKRTDD